MLIEMHESLFGRTRTEAASRQKSRMPPHGAYIGPVNNLPLNDRETPARHEDTVTLAGVFQFSGKSVNWGRTWRVHICFC